MFDDITPLLRRLAPDLRGRLAANEPLAPLTWFRVGGPAQILFTPEDEADLAYALSRFPADLPVMPVGFGSNLIVRDGGVEGIVVRLRPRGFGEVTVAGKRIAAGAVAPDKRVAEAAAAAGLGGLEFYYGIPGTIGGALTMNAGANGGETKDVLVEARAVTRDGAVMTFSNAAMNFAYRKSDVGRP
ncbi:MAG: FAD-binding protein, partial [Phreatobacter sp.]|nr:FAD-binding protein [Phreatobacter sp.]